jgi:signal recognition particle subunit SRP54
MLVALDTTRPAAIDQLVTLGSQIDVPVFATQPGDSPIKICSDALRTAHAEGRDIVMLDTAGRLHIDEQLMTELEEIKKVANPSEILLVADAMTGQDAVNIAQSFNEKLNLDGIILSKMDGDARGGAALSMISVTGKPVKFIGVGEKIDSLEPFHPERMASRILGMGDIVTLVEKAQDTVDMDEAASLEKRLREDKFTFDDLKNQLKQIRKMGSLEGLLSMIPGLDKQVKGMNIEDKQLLKIEAIINSMTKQEKTNYAILNASRKRRIAHGSGTTVPDVNRLIKQYIGMKKMMKKFKRSGKFKMGNFLNMG